MREDLLDVHTHDRRRRLGLFFAPHEQGQPTQQEDELEKYSRLLTLNKSPNR
jgi:hypothetical protein